MATNLGEVKERIAQDLEPHLARLNGGEIQQAVLDAVEYYADEPLHWLDAISTGLTTTAAEPGVSGTNDNALPTNLLTLDFVTVAVSGDNYPVEAIPYDYYRWLQTNEDDTTGQPYRYSLYADKIWWYPTPDAAYPYTLYYRRRLTTLSADSDTNEWITYGWRLLRYHADADLGVSPLDLPDQMIARWTALAERELIMLRGKSLGRMMLPQGRARDF